MVYAYVVGLICCAMLAAVGITALIIMRRIHKDTLDLTKEISEQANMLIANAIEKERITLDEYREAIGKPTEGTPSEFNNVDKPEYEGGFNPHAYTPVDDE